MPNALLGDDYRVFWDTGANFASPTWVEQKYMADIALADSKEQVEIPVRLAWKFYKAGRQDTELTFTLPFNPADNFHVDVRDKTRNGSKIHLAICEGSNINAADYLHAWWIVTGDWDMSLDSPATFEVSARLAIDFGTNEEPTYVNN